MGKQVEVPEKYYRKFEERAPEKGFDTPEEYMRYVLGQVYEKLQDQDDSSEAQDEEKVKDKLKDLGYMD